MARSVKTKQTAEDRDRTYFRTEHRYDSARLLSSVWKQKTKTGVYVHYKFYGSPAKFKAPRSLTKWLDDKDGYFIDLELDNWKARVNQTYDGKVAVGFEPEFFLLHKDDYLRFCATKAKKQSIQNYLSRLQRYVFPFFVQRMELEDPKKWSAEYHRWDDWLEQRVVSPVTRNHIRTALRRYLKFLEKKQQYPKLTPPTNENFKKGQREGKTLPDGKLPTYAEALTWLDTLPAGRARWVIALCIAFGVRISEALPATEYDLIGDDEVDSIRKHEDLIKSVLEMHRPFAFFHVSQAKKRQITWKQITKVLGKDEDTDPKSGPYIAACFDADWALRIHQLIKAGEDKAEFSHADWYKEVLDAIRNSPDPLFNKYGLHDFRRFNITRQVLQIHDWFAVARLHGQASVDTVKRYYQWGTEITRKKAKTKFKPIKHSS